MDDLDDVSYGPSIPSVIKRILDSYPAGAAVLRELLQNSDDAKATKQIFLLDARRHESMGIEPSKLSKCQGEALLAINNSEFRVEDRRAILRIQDSSKLADETTTGKFGLGFLSCYHITENPQIYSDKLKLLVLDPYKEMSAKGFVRPSSELALDPFRRLNEKFQDRTIIRLPLRTAEQAKSSEIKERAITAEDIRKWFRDFIDSELRLGMLFLKHITSVELWEINDDTETNIACVSIRNPDDQLEKRSRDRGRVKEQEHYNLELSINDDGQVTSELWTIVHFVDNYDQVVTDMSNSSVSSTESVIRYMAKDKLLPHVAVAIPIQGDTILPCTGKLFTLLPLPIITEFPVHIHSVFALTTDRQRLRNAQEKLDRGSREEFLVLWNRYIFDNLLPMAWSHLLQVLVAQSMNISAALPSVVAHSSGATGDQTYWASVPKKLLEHTNSANIWSIANKGGYGALKSLFVADMEIDIEVVNTLTAAGVSVSLVPQNVIQLLESCSEYKWRIMSPATASSQLKLYGGDLENLNPGQLYSVSEYIASAEDIQLFDDLCLIPNAAGRHICIKSSGGSTFVSEEEAVLFGSYDPDLVALEAMSPIMRRLFERPGILSSLDDSDILRCLGSYRSEASSRVTSPEQIKWFCQFWKYVSSEGRRKGLIAKLEYLYLLPAQNGHTRKMSDGICDQILEDGFLKSILETAGVPFIHPSICLEAKEILKNSKQLYSETHIPFLLKCITNPLLSPQGHSRHHLSQHFETNIASYLLPPQDQQLLRRLPIFPVLDAGSRQAHSVSYMSAEVPNTYFLDSKVELVPKIRDKHFVDISRCRNIVGALSDAQVLDEEDMLKLVIEQNIWVEQPLEIKKALVDRMASRFPDLCKHEGVKEKIHILPLIDVGGGRYRPPCEVVDPYEDLAILFEAGDQMLPVPPYSPMLQRLREYSMLLQHLTVPIIEERINGIFKLRSLKLLELVDNHFLMSEEGRIAGLDFPAKSSFFTASWLFCPDSPKAVSECRDRHPEISTLLHDLVLPVVDYTLKSRNLRNLLGWNKVPVTVLFDQFRKAVELSQNEAYQRLHDLILEITARRHDGSCLNTALEDLRSFLVDREWVPANGKLVRAKQCFLDEELSFGTLSGFLRPVLLITEAPQVRSFLEEMGICNRPSKAAVLERLREIGLTGESHSTSEFLARAAVIELLTELVDSSNEPLHSSDREFLLVPIVPFVNGRTTVLFAKVDDVCFNNTEQSFGSQTKEDVLFAHSAVSKELAERLGIERWSDRQFNSDNATFTLCDYHEDFIGRIKRILQRGYQRHSSLNEWVANAIDAGASSLSLYLNAFTSEVKAAPSPSLAKYCSGHSLLVHNSSTFTNDDFEGLLKVGLGGKAGRPDAIGRFGLGVLSFFHFGDIVVVISKGTIIFLDPSGEHLPRRRSQGDDRKVTALKMELSECNSQFPDLFDGTRGIQGFRPDDGYFNGTIFWIPLRTPKQAESYSAVLNTACTAEEVMTLDYPKFFQLAEKSFFFSELKSIEAFYRENEQVTPPAWSIRSNIEPREVGQGSAIMSRYLVVEAERCEERKESKWLVVSDNLPRPPEHDSIAEIHRIPEAISTGMAVCLDSHYSFSQSHSLLARLPLSISVLLPCHFSAPWILSEDRRKLQLEGTESDSKFNVWLISEVLPPLYLHAIAILSCDPDTRQMAQSLWPTNSKLHPFEQSLTQGLRRHFATSDEQVCQVQGDVMIQPRQAIFAVNGSEPIYQLLARVKSNFVNTLPFGESSPSDWSDMQTVSAVLVRQTLLDHTSALSTWIKDSQINLEEIILYLHGGSQSLAGLPLLLLQNGAITCFKEFGQKTIVEFNEDLVALFGEENFLAKNTLQQATIATLVDAKSVNLRKVDDEVLRDLLEDWCSKTVGAIAENPKHFGDVRNWLDEFWKKFSILQKSGAIGGLDNFLDLPLIPTIDGELVSAVAVRDGRAFWKSALTQEQSGLIVNTLVDFGAVVVDLQYHSVLSSLEISLTADTGFVLRCLNSLVASRDLASLSSSNGWHALAQRIKESISRGSEILENHPILTQLPLWESFRFSPESKLSMKASTDVIMLPCNIEHEVLKGYFIATPNQWYTCHDPSLNTFLMQADSGKALSTSDFLGRLSFPESITGSEIPRFHLLIETLLRYQIPLASRAIVPNSIGQLCTPNKLYDENQRLYSIAFSDQRDRFVHPEFRDMVPIFLDMGLNQAITAESFVTAVEALDKSTRDGFELDPDGVIFRLLNELPWVFPQGSRDEVWSRLRRLRFVKRRPVRTTVSAFESLSPRLASVLAFDKLVLDAHWSISWTQRALFADEPSSDLMAVFGSIGEPSVDEVLRHLTTITKAARDRPNDAYLLFADIKDTYDWLEEHSEVAKALLRSHQTTPIFLNVDHDELSSGVYHWHSARTMWFDLKWDNGEHHPVKEFLQPYGRLLESAGVRSFSNSALSSPESSLKNPSTEMRTKFQHFRSQEKFIDIELMSTEGDRLKGHRLVLAASSDPLSDLLAGDFEEGRIEVTEGRPMSLSLPHSTAELGILLDYVYTDTFQHPATRSIFEATLALEILLNVLDLSQQWSLPGLKYLASEAIVNLELIQPTNIDDVIERARDAEAAQLLEKCEKDKENMR